MDQERKSPFRPGAGEAPPHRAGHKDAERVLLKRVGRLVDEEPGGMVVLYGPRGTGKTVLLTEIEAQATERGVQARALNPNSWGNSTEAFIRRLALGVIDQSRVKGEVTLKVVCAKLKIAYDPGFVSPVAEEILRRMMEDKPVALLVDEAHRLPPEIADCLLNAVQECVRKGGPLLLVLAGTPGIEANLSQAHASFWERSRQLRLGRLESQDDIRAALTLPAEREGMPFSPEALDLLVKESQGYPYFIQLLGEQSWDVAIARDPGAERITLEDAQIGVSMAGEQRDALYGRRLQEITERKMKPEALAVSRAFVAPDAGNALSRAKLGTVLKPVLTEGRTVDDAINELSDVGLIWRTRNHSIWEPGIPSLCTHITEHLVID